MVKTGILIALIVLAAILLLAALFLALRLKRCPKGKLMVVYGGCLPRNADGTPRSFCLVREGFRLVLPLLQGYAFLDLAPMRAECDLRDQTDDPNLGAVWLTTFRICDSGPEAERAAEHLLGLETREIVRMAGDIIAGQLKALLAESAWSDSRSRFAVRAQEAVARELLKVGICTTAVGVKGA